MGYIKTDKKGEKYIETKSGKKIYVKASAPSGPKKKGSKYV